MVFVCLFKDAAFFHIFKVEKHTCNFSHQKTLLQFQFGKSRVGADGVIRKGSPPPPPLEPLLGTNHSGKKKDQKPKAWWPPSLGTSPGGSQLCTFQPASCTTWRHCHSSHVHNRRRRVGSKQVMLSQRALA